MTLAELFGLSTLNWIIILGLLVLIIVLVIVKKRQQG